MVKTELLTVEQLKTLSTRELVERYVFVEFQKDKDKLDKVFNEMRFFDGVNR